MTRMTRARSTTPPVPSAADGNGAVTADGVGRRVMFRMTHRGANRLYVLLRAADQRGSSLLTQMNPKGNSTWEVALPIGPGVYRYRYYAQKGDVITYVPPAADDDRSLLQMLGMDAVLVVPPQKWAARTCEGEGATALTN